MFIFFDFGFHSNCTLGTMVTSAITLSNILDFRFEANPHSAPNFFAHFPDFFLLFFSLHELRAGGEVHMIGSIFLVKREKVFNVHNLGIIMGNSLIKTSKYIFHSSSESS